MYAIATCRASVLRGTGTDQWGDASDSGTVVNTGLLARVVVKNVTAYDPSTQTARTVQQVIGVVESDTDILDTDQLRDDTNGITYIIESVTQPGGPGRADDLVLELRRVK